MKCWAVTNVARQIDGEYCLVMIEMAFSKKSEAEDYAASVKGEALIDVPTPNGIIKCLVERGILPFELRGVTSPSTVQVAVFGDQTDCRSDAIRRISNGDDLFGNLKYVGMVGDDAAHKRKGKALIAEADAVVILDNDLQAWRACGEMEIEEFRIGDNKFGNNFKPTEKTVWLQKLEEDD